ncbi:MAG: hypothetical protein EAZ89_06480 [Bacteroidetes bacterium]|nr:MAG: hypothetical protein EAZ89_06480 [Bacteroidota bacterium]
MKQDEWIKHKLESRQFEFREEYWTAAEALIESERRRKRRWWLWLPLIFAAGAGAGWLIWNTVAPPPAAGLVMVRNMPPELPAEAICQTGGPEEVREMLHSPQSHHPEGHESAHLHRHTPTSRVAGLSAEECCEVPVNQSLTVQSRRDEGKTRAAETPAYTPEEVYRMPLRSHRLVLNTGGSLQPGETPGYLWNRHFMGMITGASWAAGWQNVGTNPAAISSAPVLGLHYVFLPARNWRVNAALLYTSRSGLSSDSAYRSTDLGLGFRQEVTVVSPQRLHMIEVPVYLDRRVAGRHYVMAGVYGSWMLDASAKLERYLLTDFGRTELGNSSGWGYRQGFRRADYGLSLGYGYYLGRGLRLSLQGSAGLRDMTDPAFFNSLRKDRNLRVRIMLEYDWINLKRK